MGYEYPPILQGSTQQQVAALRDYLVRVARSMEGEARVAGGVGLYGEGGGGRDPSTPLRSAQDDRAGRSAEKEREEKLAAIRRNAAKLQALIIKTADEAETLAIEIGGVRQEMESYYLARSDFGEYMEQAKADFTTTARGVVESYGFTAMIEAVSGRADELDGYLSSIQGEIRRGMIEDPETHERALGIAIAENLRFTGQVHEQDGLKYYELAPGQTLGLYTSTGWQFWVNGSKRGWFDSADGSLHVISEVVEDTLQLGEGWTMSTAGGFGIRRT